MTIQITLYCPGCQSSNVVKNGHKSYSEKQNYLCKDCQRQFIGDHNLSYSGCHRPATRSGLAQRLRRMFVRGMGIRDIAEVEQISLGKVLHWLSKLKLVPQPKCSYYDELEVADAARTSSGAMWEKRLTKSGSFTLTTVRAGRS